MPTRREQARRRWIRLGRCLLERQDGQCPYCGCPLFLPRSIHPPQRPKHGRPATFDHVIPRTKGGRTDPENLVLACRECNGAKADLLPLDFFMTGAARDTERRREEHRRREDSVREAAKRISFD